MRRRYFSILALVCLLTLVSSEITADAFAQDLIKDVDACGFVVDQSGRPVSEVTITAKSGENVIATATSLSDGSFSFVQSINSPVQLHVTAKGYAEASDTVERMRSAGFKKCGRPLYAVLAMSGGNSFLTTKKKSLPKTK
jgi:Carboxypeptidase regulatory-like domain